MTHPHKLDLLQLGQFFRVSGDLASRRAGRGPVIVRRRGGTREVFR